MERHPLFVDWRLNIAKIQYDSKQSIDLMQALSKSQWLFFGRNRKVHLKIHILNLKGTSNNQNKFEKQHNVRSHEATVIKTVFCDLKDTYSPTDYNRLSRNKLTHLRKPGERTFFNKWCWKNWVFNAEERSWTLILCHIQNLTQNGSKT